MPSTSSISWRASGRALSTASRIHCRSCGDTEGSKVNDAALTWGSMACSREPQPARATASMSTTGRRSMLGCIGRRVRFLTAGYAGAMSSIPAGRSTAPTAAHAPETEGWFSALGVKGRRAFRAAFAGYMLDAFDLIVLTLSLSAIGATFGVGTDATGALSTVTLSASAVGGILGGVLADRIGRARTLMLSVAVYSVFTFLSGLATSYEMLMVFRVFQGIGFGAEWGVGAVLVAELVRPESRGRALGIVQSAWASGWAVAVVAYLITFELFDETTAWRVLMCLGILPALLILYVRSRVEEPEVFREAPRSEWAPLKQILSGRLLKTTIAASLLATGIQGGYYAMFTWIPTFLKSERGLTVVGTSGYLFVVIAGAFLGYLTAGWAHDR